MKIAIFTNNYLPNPYGVSMSIESFRIEFEKRGHAVYIFAPYTKGYEDKNPNVFRYPSFDINYKISFPLAIPLSRHIDKILEKLEIDVIHSQHPNLLGWKAKKWAKKKNVPLVFTWHTLYDQYTNFVPLIPNYLAAKWVIGNAVKYANACEQIIVPTKSVEKIIREWGVANKNIIDIMSGVDEKEFSAEGRSGYGGENIGRAGIRKKYGISEKEILAYIIGRLTSEKNVDFLMRAMSAALRRKPDLKFMVSGEGYDAALMKKIAKENGVENRTIFTGLISREERKNYFAASDFFVYSSKSETQGMILTEAHYMGLPIVAVEAPGSRDVIKNNETGFLVEENEDKFADAVIRLTEDFETRKKFSESAKKIARENYTASACAEKMLEVYERAIRRKKP